MVLLVETSDGVDESVGYAMLVIQIDGLLNGLVTNHVAVSKVLSDDARARLVLLCNLIGVTIGIRSVVTVIGVCRCAGNLNLSGTKLCVIEEESSLRSSLLFECDGSTLGGVASWDKLELGDLATEGEEVLDLLLAGLQADVLDVDDGCHDVGCFVLFVLF